MRLWSHGAASKIAATAAALAVTGAFGVGAYALTQDGSAFDPTGFASAYDKGAQDSQKGYKATAESTDSAANRHNDNADNDEESAEQKAQKDAFSELPNNGKGTTAVSVNPNAKPGTSAAVDDPSSGNGNGGNGGGNPTGPTTDNNGNGGGSSSSDDNGGSGSDNPGGTGGNAGDNNGSTTKPDTPGGNNGSGSGSSSGSTGGSGSGSGGQTSADEKSDVDETPKVTVTDADVSNGQDQTFTVKPASGISSNSHYTVIDDNATEFFPSDVRDILIDYSTSSDAVAQLYVGQKATAWDLFCALDAFVIDNKGNTFVWQCSKEKFDSYQSYFKINGITKGDGEQIGFDESGTVTIPEGEFTINVSYKCGPNFPNGQGTKDVTVAHAASSLSYIIDPNQKDSSGNPKVLAAFADEPFNLSAYNQAVLQSSGSTDADGFLTKLLTGWVDENGEAAPSGFINAGESYAGRHVYKPQGYSDFQNDVYKVKLVGQHIRYTGTKATTKYVYYQTLVGLKNGSYLDEVDVPDGVQAIKIEDNQEYGSGVPGLFCNVLKLPSSVQSIDFDNGNFAVEDSFIVSEDNPWLTTCEDLVLNDDETKKTNILLSKGDSGDAASILGIPSGGGWSKLLVPEGISSVAIAPSNTNIETMLLETTDNLPEIVSGKLLRNCTLVVANDELRKQALEQYKSIVIPKLGNAVRLQGDDQPVYSIYDGMTIEDGILKSVEDEGIDILRLDGIANIGSKAFSGVSDVSAVILDSYITADRIKIESDAFANSSVKYVICTENQRSALEKVLVDDDDPELITIDSTGNGIRYATAGDDVILLNGSNTMSEFDGSIAVDNETSLGVTKVAPDAFAECTALRWVDLDESVKQVGTRAFDSCSNLEGILVENTDSFKLEADALTDCDTLRFFASNAEQAELVDFAKPNDSCQCFHLPNASGYDPYIFSSDCNRDYGSLIASFSMQQIADADSNAYALYADWAEDDEYESHVPFLCLCAGSSIEETVVLPESTEVIYTNAFKKTGGSFDVDWEDLPILHRINANAFSNSGLKGEVSCSGVVYDGESNPRLYIGDSAFEKCTGLTAISLTPTYLNIGNGAFAGCTNLTEATIACNRDINVWEAYSYESAMFDSCDDLKSVTLAGNSPASLTTYDRGASFFFNSAWTEDSNAVGIFKLEQSSDALLDQFVQQWTYSFAGAADFSEIEESVRNAHRSYDEKQLYKATVSELTKAENQVRRLFGMDLVDSPTVEYPKMEEETIEGMTFLVREGTAKLIAVSDSAVSVDLTSLKEDQGWDKLVIKAGAFKGCSALTKVTVPDDVDEIESTAFEGLGDNATIEFTGNSLPKLTGGSADHPFVFASTNVRLEISDQPLGEDEPSLRAKCLKEWPAELLGYSIHADLFDDDSLYNLYFDLMWNGDDFAVDKLLLEQENRLRDMLGMEKIAEPKELAYSFYYDGLGNPREQKTIDSDEITVDGKDDAAVDASDDGSGDADGNATEVPKTSSDDSGVSDGNGSEGGKNDEAAESAPSEPEASASEGDPASAEPKEETTE